jgi:Zn-dependent peptidase ImmA (M78 family)
LSSNEAEGKFAIVINPEHAVTRQRVDLMHELAHIELRHSPARVEASDSGLLLLSDYSDEQDR